MTEPEVASSDANNVAIHIELDENSDELVVTRRTRWSSGAMAPECKVAVVRGPTTPGGEKHRRHSMVVVPMDASGVHVQRSTPVLGYPDGPHGGHAEILYDAVRVPRDHLLGEWNGGFAVGRAQLGPGRFHPLYAQARMLIWLTARTRSTRWPWPVASSCARPAN